MSSGKFFILATCWGYLFLAIIFVGEVNAETPTVTRLTTDSATQTVSISGNGFGPGPKILLYDTFDSEVDIPGDLISLAASQGGSWTEINEYNPPTYANIGRSGSKSVKVFNGATQKTNQIRLKFEGTQEFFVSYWVYLDGPDYFPGDFISGPKTFSKDSSFKMLWVFDKDVKGDSSDVVLPTHVGGGRFYLAGNDANLVTNVGNDWWSWDHWMRLSFWVKANPTDPTAPGIIEFDTLSLDKGYKKRVYNVPVFDDDGPSKKQYQQMNFPGWVRSIQNKNTNILYDDIYVSTGPNSAARVELGNAPNIENVTRLELLTIYSWTDTEIQARASTVDRKELSGLYLYLTNSEGVTNNKGIPLASAPSVVPSFEIR